MNRIGLVSGFGRCGTTLVMAMCSAGGLSVAGAAPVYESFHFNSSRADQRWLAAQDRKIVKWVSPLDTYVSSDFAGPVIWLDRRAGEQAKSQIKLAIACGDTATASVDEYTSFIQAHTLSAKAAAARVGPVLHLSFEALIEKPTESAALIASHFSQFGKLDICKAAAVVKRRDSDCLHSMEWDVAEISRSDLWGWG